MRQAENNVFITGILNEVNLEVKNDTKKNKNYISGKVIFLVDQEIDGSLEREEIPVEVFAYEYTNANKPHPGYRSAVKLMEEGISVAACGEEAKADRYSVGGGNLSTSEFEGQDGRKICRQTIRGSFFNKVKNDLENCADIEAEIFIKSIADEVKNDEITGRLVVNGIIVGYGDRIDEIPFIVENPSAIDYITNHWSENDTVKIYAKIRSTVVNETRESSEVVGFGTAPKHNVSRTVKEYVIISGSSEPYDEGLAYSIEDIQTAIVAKRENSNPNPTQVKRNNRGF